jgi:hypothetical protein
MLHVLCYVMLCYVMCYNIPVHRGRPMPQMAKSPAAGQVQWLLL